MSFKQRLAEIKKQRMDSEQLFINTKIQELNDFDVEQKLIDNEEKATKDLSSMRKWSIVPGSILATSVGLIGLGAATVATGGLALGSVFAMGAGGAMALGTLTLDPDVNATLMSPFKSAKKHNFDMVQKELSDLSQTVETAAINNKTTVKDFFSAAKETIKDTFQSIKSAFFAPKTPEEVSSRINKMKKQQEESLKNSSGKLKLS